MKLKKLIQDLPEITLKGPKEIEITGISANSKLVAPGNLYIAKKGKTHDGGEFIQEALQAGANAILSDLYDPGIKDVPQLVVKDINSVEAKLLKTFYRHPSHELLMIGVTGTSGKTTVSYMLKHVLEHFIGPAGIIGTIEYQFGDVRHTATHSTPDIERNYKMLREMADMKMSLCIMEVTSHALSQGRVEGIDFDAALFTNLTPEHLDYHLNMEAYAESKCKLFKSLDKKAAPKKNGKSKIAIINKDSPYFSKMCEASSVPILSYGLKEADITAESIDLGSSKTHFFVRYKDFLEPCTLPFAGLHNVYNALSVIALALSFGFPLKEIVERLRGTPPVPGRLEKVKNKSGVHVYIDYAHKPDALENILRSLKMMPHSKLITVFGCGGDRDRLKRSVMGSISESFSDFTIVTSDNPRTEKPEDIISEIVKGFKSPSSYQIVMDRKEAIFTSLKMASKNDIVLIAGKGHEAYQVFSHQTVPFDDRLVVNEFFAMHES